MYTCCVNRCVYLERLVAGGVSGLDLEVEASHGRHPAPSGDSNGIISGREFGQRRAGRGGSCRSGESRERRRPGRSEGTTIYDGDRLSTDADGELRLFIGEAVLRLGDRSSVIVRETPSKAGKEFEAELLAGTVVLSVTTANGGEVVACSAQIRPVSETRGVVRVQIFGPHELNVYAQRGAAQISYRGETETIAEGKAYRVLLNDPADGAARGQGARISGKRRKALLLIAIGAGAALAVGIAVAVTGGQKAVESPDRP